MTLAGIEIRRNFVQKIDLYKIEGVPVESCCNAREASDCRKNWTFLDSLHYKLFCSTKDIGYHGVISYKTYKSCSRENRLNSTAVLNNDE